MNASPADKEEFDSAQAARPAAPFVPKTASEALRPEAGTPPPPRRSRASRSQAVVFLNFFLSCVILLLLAVGAGFYFGRQAFIEPGPSDVGDTFLVKPGMRVAEIADQLERSISHSRAIKRAIGQAMRKGAQGLKIVVAGRLAILDDDVVYYRLTGATSVKP